VAENNLDIGKVPGSGRDGRVTKADVLAYLSNPAPAAAAVAAAPAAAAIARAAPAVAGSVAPSAPPSIPPDARGRLEQRVPMTRLRTRIAERLVEAQQTAALLTTFNEVNMKPVMDLRARYKDKFEKQFGVRLGIMSFFVKAVIEALKRFPAVNGSIDGNDIIYHGYYDIASPCLPARSGVPIVRDADQLSFADIERAINDLGERARQAP